MGEIQKFLTSVFIVTRYICGAEASPVRKHRFSGSVAANGVVKISDDLADSIAKVSRNVSCTQGAFPGSVAADCVIRISSGPIDSAARVLPSIVRRSKEVERITVDANGIIEMSEDLRDELRDAIVRKNLLREGLRTQNYSVEHKEESRRLTTFSTQPFQIVSTRVNVTRVQSMHVTDLFGFADVPTMKSSSRFAIISTLHMCLSSYVYTVAMMFILLLLVSIVVIMYVLANLRRSDPVKQTLLETMQRFGIAPNDTYASDDSDSGSEQWEGEGQNYEGFLWKLNSQVKPEEREGWKQWRLRHFVVNVDVLVNDEVETSGIYVEYTSEKCNMTGIRYWVTHDKPAIAKRLDTIYMTDLSFSESEAVLSKANQYQIAIDVDNRPQTDLPPKLYPLSISFHERDEELILASSNRQLIRELASRLELYSKPRGQDLFPL